MHAYTGVGNICFFKEKGQRFALSGSHQTGTALVPSSVGGGNWLCEPLRQVWIKQNGTSGLQQKQYPVWRVGWAGRNRAALGCWLLLEEESMIWRCSIPCFFPPNFRDGHPTCPAGEAVGEVFESRKASNWIFWAITDPDLWRAVDELVTETRGRPKHSVQFSSFTQSCLTLCDPMDCSTPGLPVHYQLPELAHTHWDGDAIQRSHPLSLPSPPAFNLSQHQGLFNWVSSSHQVAKALEFQLQHQSFKWLFMTDLF